MDSMPPMNSPMGGKSDSHINFDYSENISRLFIFRGLWVFAIMIQIFLLGLWVGILNFFHFFHMLFLGKRSPAMWGPMARLYRWLISWQAYIKAVTDKRPDLWW